MSTSHWIDPDRIFDSVVALTDDAIYVANPSKETALAMGEALDRSEAASTVVKDDATVIGVGQIVRVRYNRHDDDIDIDYKPAREKESKNISFSSREERDDFAAQLAERLPGFEGKVVEYGRLRAALAPVLFGLFASFATWGLHAAAVAIDEGAEAEISGRRAGLKRLLYWVMDVIGPIGVLLVGGLVLVATVAVLVSRVKTPPIMHTLKPAKR